MTLSSIARFLVPAGLTLAAIGTSAAEEPLDCKKPVAQLDINLCELRAFESADAVLNAVYRRVVKAVGSDRVEALRNAQRAWVAFRQAECALAGSEAQGGSMQPMLVSICARKLTEERTRFLRTFLN